MRSWGLNLQLLAAMGLAHLSVWPGASLCCRTSANAWVEYWPVSRGTASRRALGVLEATKPFPVMPLGVPEPASRLALTGETEGGRVALGRPWRKQPACSQPPLLLSAVSFFFFFLIYLFLAVLGLRFCARAFSSCGKRGPLFIAVRGPLTVAASPAAEHRLQTRRLSSWGSRAQLLRGMWDPPRPGLEPVSPALAGRLSTTAPPGKPSQLCLERPSLPGLLQLPASQWVPSPSICICPPFGCRAHGILFCGLASSGNSG